jgi:ABC-type transport system involved in cytochrome bd biosynthesis fused ATPase/permease subunit
MNNYIVISTVDTKDYVTMVPANSLSEAEHKILDLSITTSHGYAVTACMAFDLTAVRYGSDTLAGMIENTLAASFEEISAIIEKVNNELRKKVEAEKKVNEITRRMKALQTELDEAMKILNN